MPAYFVTGTDTDAGKTLVASGLLALARRRGLTTLGLKPVASGSEATRAGLRNADALALEAQTRPTLPYATINPFAFAPAIAPHLAARRAGTEVSLTELTPWASEALAARRDLTLVEGAGGWRVPLNDRETYAAVPREMGLGVIVVIPLQLGCINHALLTVEAIQADGLRVAGWIGNRIDPEPMECEQETLNYLSLHLKTPCLGVLPWIEGKPDKSLPGILKKYVNIEPLIEN